MAGSTTQLTPGQVRSIADLMRNRITSNNAFENGERLNAPGIPSSALQSAADELYRRDGAKSLELPDERLANYLTKNRDRLERALDELYAGRI